MSTITLTGVTADGRLADELTFDQVAAFIGDDGDHGIVWIDIIQPSAGEIHAVGQACGIAALTIRETARPTPGPCFTTRRITYCWSFSDST